MRFETWLLVASAYRGAAVQVTVEVASLSAFRLGVRFGSMPPAALPSPSLAPNRTVASSSKVSWGGMSGLQTSFGALLVGADGSWVLYDSHNNTVLRSDGPPAFVDEDGGTVQLPVKGVTATAPNQACAGNGNVAPAFFWSNEDKFLALPVSTNMFDPASPPSQFVHCYPAGFGWGSIPTISVFSIADSSKSKCAVQLDRTGCFPNACTESHRIANATRSSCCAACDAAGSSCVAWQFFEAGHDSHGDNCQLLATVTKTQSATDSSMGWASSNPNRGGWWASGQAADWYLAPVSDGKAMIKSLWLLTGSPAVPPKFAFGFMATYWGYDDMQEVVNNMTAFRSGAYPIDSFIMDYDWFGPDPCGSAGQQGGLNCGDFGYSPKMFGNNTFTINGKTVLTSGAAELFALFRSSALSMRFAGIRKPRSYSNVALSVKNGWLLPDEDAVGAGGNNWNFSVPEFSAWYTQNHLHFLQDGVDFWWNDEGETQWFTYLWQAQAQAAMVDAVRPGQRKFTINRSFQLGMQTLAASTWTGDNQDCAHENVLVSILSGQPYVSCDMKAPSATGLVRQYQNSVLLPIMRVHAMHGVPRFPFLWCGSHSVGPGGTPEHCDAFRQALNTRYALIPFLYSLAHRAHTEQLPIAHPASFEFPEEPSSAVKRGPTKPEQYMVGGVLLPSRNAAISADDTDVDENTTITHLPKGGWWKFNFNSTGPAELVDGGRTLVEQVTLAEFPIYVRQGALIPMNSERVDHTGQLGGGLLLHIYSGASGSFTLVEDDGVTEAYKAEATRATAFDWDTLTNTLTWTVTGGVFSNQYTAMDAVLFELGAPPKHSSMMQLGSGGKFAFGK